jgi:hypothetical protein
MRLDKLTTEETERMYEIYKVWCEQRLEKASVRDFLDWYKVYYV